MRSLLTSRRHPVRRPRCHHLLLGVVVITATINVFIGFNPLEQIEQQKQELQQDTKLKQPEQQEQQTNQEPYGQHEGEQEEQHQLQNEKEPEKHQLQNEQEPEKQQLQNEKEQEQHQLQNEKEPEQHQLQNEKEPEQHQLQNEKEPEKHQLQNEKEQEKHQLQNEKEQEQHQLKNEKKPEKHQLQNKTEQEQGGQEQEQEQSSHPWPSWKDHTGKCSIDGYLWKEEDRKNMRVEHADRLVQKYLLDWTPPLPDNLTQLWSKAADWVSYTHLYPEHTPEMGTVLKAMATARVLNASTSIEKDIDGVTFKFFLTLEGGQYILYKPKSSGIDRIHNFTEKRCGMGDKYYGEIVGFHMSRILQFRKTPMVVGRKLDIMKEILPVASPELHDAISKREGRKVCVHHTCAVDGKMVGSMMLWLPRRVKFHWRMHPWGKACPVLVEHSFTHGVKVTKDICFHTQFVNKLFKGKPGLFLDLIDTAVLQYLTQNIDRKMYLGQRQYENLMPVIDNGRTFPDPYQNLIELLAPLYHCCRVRESTYQTLLQLQNGTLSYVLEAVTGQDPVAPVLSQPQLRALDRRLHYVLAHIHHCVCKHGAHNVLV